MVDSRSSTVSIVEHVRRFGFDTTGVEIKSGAGGLPKSVPETLSAFANGRGGTVLIGLSEEDGFVPVDFLDARSTCDALADACANKVSPPIRDAIELDEVDGRPVVRLDVTELDPADKPCFVHARGEYNGSFIRGADGDRRLTRYEVTQLLSNRRQPDDDARGVPGSSLDDLDPDLVAGLVTRVRRRNPRAFSGLDDLAVLHRLGAVVEHDGRLIPSLAGLLSLGTYPQQHLPQLFVAVVVLPGTQMGETTGEGVRFLDNVTVDGSIPMAIEETLAVVQRNMRTAVSVTDGRRTDHHDFPLAVVRELVVNALMHRDYSPEARGTQVQIELYRDRLEVKSPGGLYGGVDVEQLGTEDVTSSRNAVLARLLSDVTAGRNAAPVCENRGSGLRGVVVALRDAGMSPPEFDVTPGRVVVRVPQHALLGPNVIQWIGNLPARELTHAQHLALAMMRTNGAVSNQMLRIWGVDRLTATQALTDLVARGLATKSGGRRYASYRLATPVPSPPSGSASLGVGGRARAERVDAELTAVAEAIRAGHRTARAISTALPLGYQTVLRRINTLTERGMIERVGGAGSKARTYRSRVDEPARQHRPHRRPLPTARKES